MLLKTVKGLGLLVVMELYLRVCSGEINVNTLNCLLFSLSHTREGMSKSPEGLILTSVFGTFWAMQKVHSTSLKRRKGTFETRIMLSF